MRRFISMFGDVVKGVKKEHFDAALDARKAAKKAQNDTDLTAEDLVEVVRQFKAVRLAQGVAWSGRESTHAGYLGVSRAFWGETSLC